ncbi:MAG: iron(III) transport system substrate-binding protein [Solirubrobacteraceae bacterium]|jgi:iron(III) transport system substrate-binding protein|nr:iron(III) transport system substrate-binding protein [Solirubrobacteraceae bacterium]
MIVRRATAPTVALATLAVVFTACGSSGGDELTMYSGRIAPILNPAIKIYETSSGTDVKTRFGDSPSLAATITEEGKNSPADLFFAQDAGSLDAVEKQGLLLRLPADILAEVPKHYQSKEGRWVGVTGRARIIAYGPKLKESEVPDSPLDLTDPKWRGRVGWAPTNASLQGYITALRLVEGEDVARKWLEGMVANKTQAFDSNIPVRDAIAKGEIDLGLINHYYVAEAQAKDKNYPVKVHFPPKDLGSMINTAGVGVLASSKHKKEAIAFVRTMLSKQAQEYFADSSKEYPLSAGVQPAKELTPIDRIPSPKIDLAKVGDLQGTLKLMRETGAL